MIASDFHMHTCFSSDSDTPVQDMIDAAIQRGLTELCITDHMDYDYPKVNPSWTDHADALDFLFSPEEYFETLTQISQQYESQIKVRIGIELGLQAHIQPQVKQLMDSFFFDFAIGSSHLLHGADPYYDGFWRELGYDYSDHNYLSVENERIVKTAIQAYFEEILKNIDLFPWFQVYGHLDYIVRYAPGSGRFYNPNNYMELVDEILRKLIASGRGIELNTSGLKSGLPYANPHIEILKHYKELGGEIITIGSDAHVPDYVAYQFHHAEDFLRSSGFTHYTTFEKKKPIFHKITI